MPLRLATPHAGISRNVLAAVLIVAALVGAERYIASGHRSQAEATSAPAPATMEIATASQPVSNPAPAASIIAADGSTVPADRLRGRWTILFAPGEPCRDQCAKVLETLSAVAHDPASGVQDGTAQVILTRPQGREAARELVVLDPEGHSAGMMSHVTDAGRIVSGLATLRASYVANTTTASR
jgi:hypothetical protein